MKQQARSMKQACVAYLCICGLVIVLALVFRGLV